MPATFRIKAQPKHSPKSLPMKSSTVANQMYLLYASLAPIVMSESYPNSEGSLMPTLLMAYSVVWIPSKKKFISSHDVIVYEKIFSKPDDEHIPTPPPNIPTPKCVARPSWKKQAAEIQKAKSEKEKAERKTRRKARAQHQHKTDANTSPVENTTVGEVAQLSYLAAYGQRIPEHFQAASASAEAEQWWKAMHEEFEMLQKRGTWELVEKPKGRKVIGCRWTYALKLGPDGEIT
ncbi:uncharacterized protein EDB91DRAFT_1246188 [Suillus paluster]|uniref:uncharacterized protein n=1 Tax=Suillus paluster TaxID=48578 RepID=UPI001B85C0F1|nr:uncharacterized protein EDB91DRAFT_1246188 [Suillus paluster]KAG1746058.1 hypothetical protein EDB91DRAFT_1246188 [Suillus paluster]